MRAKSAYCFTRITSRSGLGASPRIQSISCTLRANWSASRGSPKRGGFEALVKYGCPISRMNAATVSIASRITKRCCELTQDTRGIASEISQNEIRAGSADRCERFHHDAFVIEPAALDRRHDHAEFARNLVRADGHREAVARLADQIQIRHGRLDHQHVRAFFQIELHLMHGLAAVGGIHLIRAAVAELRRRFGGFAERSIKSRCKLRGVCEDCLLY